MKALILRGKHKGKVVKISQYCNNWFSIDSDDVALATKPMSPLSLLFTFEGQREIRRHPNTGVMFQLFEIFLDIGHCQSIGDDVFTYGFKRRKA